mgnify:CR=1 FL=1
MFQGSSAKLFHHFAAASKRLHLFDTFQGCRPDKRGKLFGYETLADLIKLIFHHASKKSAQQHFLGLLIMYQFEL